MMTCVDAPQEAMERAHGLHLQGELSAALALYGEMLESYPASAEIHYRRANVLKDQGSLEAAVAAYADALALKPEDTRALCNQAVVLGLRQKFPEALAGYDRAITVDPNDGLIHCNRAILLNAIGRKDAAAAAFDKAIACNAGLFSAHFGRGALLQERQHWLDSLASYDRAIALNPTDLAAQFNRATVLRQLERWADALAGYDRSLALNADFAQGHGGRALVLQTMGKLDDALASYNQAIAIDSQSAQVYFNRGTLRAERLDFAGASADFQNAIAVDPEFAEAHLNLALISLKIGDYPRGWAHYEWRWHITQGPIRNDKRTFTQPLWLGESDIAGRTLLIYGEQGLGDSLQFCRFGERLSSLGARVVLEVPRPLFSLCATLRGVSEVISHGDRLPAFDCHCPLMSLPLALGVTLETVGVEIPYLHSDPYKVAAWQERLGAKSRPRIGLTWSGSQASRSFSPRSYPLAKLISYLPDGFDYFCTQTEITAGDQATLSNFPGIRHFASELKDFSDTAALCECLDLVITVDTSIAHLNGALGKPTWVLVPYDGDWRWLTGREDSPWYPAVRLFRQTTRGDWDGVFRRVAEQLQPIRALNR